LSCGFKKNGHQTFLIEIPIFLQVTTPCGLYSGRMRHWENGPAVLKLQAIIPHLTPSTEHPMEPTSLSENEALLVMDIQDATMKNVKDSANLVHSLLIALQTARRKKIPVIYVVVGFRKGYPEVSPSNKSFSTLKKNGTLALDTDAGVQIHPSVAPEPGEIVVTKKRVSSFTGSDLEIILRSFQIKRLVLSGISTSGVVLSTVREAADKDYAITILSDCCFDLDEEVHRVLMTKIFPRQAEVKTAEEWAQLHHE